MSKQTRLILPPMLTLFGEMQKMSFLRNRAIANDVPMDIVAGRAGGTTMVIRSKPRMRIVCHGTPNSTKLKQLPMKPTPAIPASTPMNRNESR